MYIQTKYRYTCCTHTSSPPQKKKENFGGNIFQLCTFLFLYEFLRGSDMVLSQRKVSVSNIKWKCKSRCVGGVKKLPTFFMCFKYGTQFRYELHVWNKFLRSRKPIISCCLYYSVTHFHVQKFNTEGRTVFTGKCENSKSPGWDVNTIVKQNIDNGWYARNQLQISIVKKIWLHITFVSRKLYNGLNFVPPLQQILLHFVCAIKGQ